MQNQTPLSSFPPEFYAGSTSSKVDQKEDTKFDSDPRPFFVKASVVSSANGSAYLEAGQTKILCTVHGPRNVVRHADSYGTDLSNKGTLQVCVRFAPFARPIRIKRKETQQQKRLQETPANEEEQKIGDLIQDAFKSVVILERFPKAQVDIRCTILQDDGSVFSALVSCISLALVDGGIDMYDFLIGTTVRIFEDKRLTVDPNSSEEKQWESDQCDRGLLSLGLMPSLNQISFFHQTGAVHDPTSIHDATRLAMDTAYRLCAPIQQAVLKSVLKKSDEQNRVEDS